MNTDIYRFKLGDFQCIAVSDGTYTYSPPTFPPPAIFLFANAPRERLEKTLREHNLYPGQWACHSYKKVRRISRLRTKRGMVE